MEYCARCMYPANAKPTIILDDDGVCSGCRYHESRSGLDWTQREGWLRELLGTYQEKARSAGNPYDCIIPVSGGKDSHYQAYLMKERYGMNPLFVTFNHTFNSRLGVRNLRNMIERFGCDLVRLTVNPIVVQKLSRYMVKRVGDLTWHYHCGIMTFPFQIAVKYNIPLIIWGEQGYSELTGMFRIEDMPEFTTWQRKEHDMRGLDLHDIANDPESGITMRDLAPYEYPTDEQIAEVGVRGIYLSNYLDWDAKAQAELMMGEYGFRGVTWRRDRTFNLCAKTDDHANDVHDYLKYLKFGYGRATDDASIEIRHGRMTREEGVETVRIYDAARPRTLDKYLAYLQLTEREFEESVERMRDPDIWERGRDGAWRVTDWVGNHVTGPQVEAVRVPQSPDRTFSEANRLYYYNEQFPPKLGETVVQMRRQPVRAAAGTAVLAAAPADAIVEEAIDRDEFVTL